jgi:hypothetical protein
MGADIDVGDDIWVWPRVSIALFCLRDHQFYIIFAALLPFSLFSGLSRIVVSIAQFFFGLFILSGDYIPVLIGFLA